MHLAPVVAIATTELRRSIRVIADDRMKLLLSLVLALLFFAPVLALGVLFLPTLGELVASGGIPDPGIVSIVEIATGAVAMVWVAVVLLSALRTTTSVGAIDQPAFLLLAAPVRTVVLGRLAAELGRYVLVMLVPGSVLIGAFSYGYGSPRPVAIVAGVVALVLASAVPLGFLIGIAIRHLITVYEPIARYRTVVVVAVFVAYFFALFLGWFDRIVVVLFTTLADGPLGWPGHALLLTVPEVEASHAAIAAAIAMAAIVGTLAIRVGERAAAYHWFADPAKTADTVIEHDRPARLEAVLGRVADRQVRSVAIVAIRRTRRAPIRLIYVAYPFLFSLFLLEDVFRTGRLPPYGAVLVSVLVVWASGALFTLNPLGESGSALPLVLASPVSGRTLIHGLLLAALAISAPFALVVAVGIGFVSPVEFGQWIALALATAVGIALAPVLGAGIGVRFPRFGSVRITRSREAVMPSKAAFVVYSLVLALAVGAGLTLSHDAAAGVVAAGTSWLLSTLPWIAITVPATAVTVGAWVGLAATAVAPVLSYRYAVHRIDAYTIE